MVETNILGLNVTIQPSTRKPKPISLGADNTATVIWLKTNLQSLYLEFGGLYGDINITGSCEVPCRVEDDRLHFEAGTCLAEVSELASARPNTLLRTVDPNPFPLWVAARPGGQGLGFMETESSLSTLVREASPSSVTGDYLVLGDAGWFDVVMTPVVAGRRGDQHLLFEGLGTQGSIFLAERFFIDGLDLMENDQGATFTWGRISGYDLEVHFAPDDGVMWLSADMRAMHVAVDDGDILDSFLYQYALVNGVLAIRATANTSQGDIDWSRDYVWKRRIDTLNPAAGQPELATVPAVVLLRWMDEHGNPVGLTLDMERQEGDPDTHSFGELKLWVRAGRISPIDPDDPVADDPELINKTLTITPGETGVEHVVRGHIRAIDPLSYSTRKKKLESLSPVDRPYWVNKGYATFTKAPTSVHGLTFGTFFERVKPATGHLQGSPAGFAVNGVEAPGGGLLYVKAELEFDNVQNWQISTMLEERDVSEQVDSPDVRKVGKRSAVGQGGQPADQPGFRVPAPDTNIVFANTAGEGRAEQTIRALGEDWLKTTNDQLLEQKFGPERTKPQRHRAGARILPPSELRQKRVIDLPPNASETLAATGKRGADLEVIQTAQPAAVAVNQDDAAKTNFLFGGTGAPNLDESILKETKNEIFEPFAESYRNFAKLWNAAELNGVGRDVKDAIVEVRKFLSSEAPTAEDITKENLAAYLDEAAEHLRGIAQRKVREGQQMAEDLEAIVPGMGEVLAAVHDDLASVSPAILKAWWRLDRIGTLNPEQTAALKRYIWHPADQSLYRNALLALYDINDAAKADLKEEVRDRLDVIEQKILKPVGGAGLDRWGRRVKEVTKALPTPIKQGLERNFQAVAARWEAKVKKGARDQLDALWARYGGQLTADVYEELSRLEADAKTLLDTYREYAVPLDQHILAVREIKDNLTAVWNAQTKAAKKLRDAFPDRTIEQAIAEIEKDVEKLAVLYRACEQWAALPESGKRELSFWLIRMVLTHPTTRAKLREMWERHGDSRLRTLRDRYGELEEQVLDRLAEAYIWMSEIERSGIVQDLKSLADLLNTPPDYVLMTKRFEVKKDDADDERLWNHTFDLAKIDESGAGWRMFPDMNTTIIVKMGGNRGLLAILREIHDAYASPARKNPLGVMPGLDDGAGFNPLKVIEKQLHPDVLLPSWRGVLMIRPMADLSEDQQLVNLVGFSMITAQYIAIGGGTSDLSDLDVYAYVFKAAEPMEETKNQRKEKPRRDLHLTCTKFEAMVKNTRLESGEIVLKMDVKDLFGTDKAQAPDGDVPEEKWMATIRGTLPPEKKNASKDPRGFTFGAWFEKPLEFRVNFGFIKDVKLRAIRIARVEGRTALELDANMDFQEANVGFGFNPKGFGEMIAELKDFRIILPSIQASGKIDIGVPRLLDFDFPSVNIRLPKPRAMSLGGLEIKPFALGYFRFKLPDPDIGLPDDYSVDFTPLERLRDGYTWLTGEFPNINNIDFPYFNCTVDMGSLPGFGAVEAEGLKLEVVVGIRRTGDGPLAYVPSVGISKVGADRLTIDLFRLFKLELEDLQFGNFGLVGKGGDFNDTPKDEISAFIFKSIRMRLLGWEPLKDRDVLQLMMIHGDPKSTDDTPTGRRRESKGMMTFLNKDGGADLGFMKLYWMLIGHNLALPNKVLNSLLMPEPGSVVERDLIKDIVKQDRIKADLLDEEDWLFGAGFSVAGEFLKNCSFILHDGHYYGISLTSDWLPALIGQDRLVLGYMPGETPSQDRFMTNFRLEALDLFGALKSGEFGFEWGVNLDFLVDIGYPWSVNQSYDWFRTFSIPAGTYEAKTGYFFEKRTTLVPNGDGEITAFSAGMGFYAGYYFGFTSSVVWVNAGIGLFAMLQGTLEFKREGNGTFPNASIERLEVVGVLGILAYVDGGIDVWVLSARFRVSLQASIPVLVVYVPSTGEGALSYAANLSANYSASVRVGKGPFKWTFRVSGSYSVPVNGRVLLN